ncbi:hypothetical protein CCHL11_02633 [Colletotrichum chlorophyti]|uniref:Suppressor protein SRP40 n=1 Tax=Colletotrichum chlorophyti TaxID=708187 RepID=A0A1Q8S8N8_9PEZI|nr:hypothetical protein CCHL11_02633 [Colletotrichum chlorophyti]
MPPSAAAFAPDPAADPSDVSSAYTRLHISPFDQDLSKIVLSSAVLPKARNISYHTIETFPEKRYGFVELPAEDAEKIKKKLNGAVLKGVKMRIDKARPEQKYLPVAEDEEATGKKRKKKSVEKEERKKQKRDLDVIEGVELRDRKVKRGWTVPEEAKIREKKSKKDKEKDKGKKDKKDKHKKREERSKYTDKEECLLKTKLPAKLPAAATATTEPEEEADRKKKKKTKSREIVVHEFEKTTKFPSFLKATKPAPAESLTTEFIEGKGWVDTQGNVIEPAKTRRTATAPAPESKPGKSPKASKKAKTTPPPQTKEEDDSTSSSGTSSDEDTSSDDSSDEDTEAVEAKPATPANKSQVSKPAPPVEDDTTSSSGTSSDESSSDDSSDEEMEDADNAPPAAALESPVSALKAESRPRSSGSNVSLSIKIPPPATPAKVHPLEALYKRQKPDDNSTPQAVKEAEPFSFFGAGGDNDDLEEDDVDAPASQLPMTPFTKQEFEWRNVRSAAPTPDTAYPNRTKPFWAIGHDDEEEEEDEETQEEVQATLNEEQEPEAEDSGPATDFQKWFWENRRNLNQSWMKRRKTAAKEKRHKDNKSRASKAV